MNNFFTVPLESIDRAEVMRCLAAGGHTPDGTMSEIMDSCEKRLLSEANGRFTFRVFGIASDDGERVTLENSLLVLSGKDISAHLKGCVKAVLLCATIGADADKLIRRAQVGDMAEAVMTDAMASAAIEQVCDKAEEVLRKEFPDMFMTWRFSAGYGDFPIETQKMFLEVTDAGRAIGLFANENNILTPKKSVTAVIGLSGKPVESKRRGCASCNMKGKCPYRKDGNRCG